jgi:hypothetical protein
MEFSQLQAALLDDFSIENLNYLSTRIIRFHKKKNFEALKRVAAIVEQYYPLPEDSQSRLFSRLIVLFHPDKLQDYQGQITACKNLASLQVYAYLNPVLAKIDIINSEVSSGVLSPDEFEAAYGWNYHPTGDDYFISGEEEEPRSHWFDEENPDDSYFYTQSEGVPDGSFLTALKRKIYGPAHIDFPVHLLEDLEEIDMAEYEIEDLDGIEFCVYAKVIDLSYNLIFDITKLKACAFTQELYLASNQIHDIEVLAGLQDLRMVDLSVNKINDISPLFYLNALEFVNLLGNPVRDEQILKLKARGVVVVN